MHSLLVRKDGAKPGGPAARSGGPGRSRAAADTPSGPAASCAPMVDMLVPARGTGADAKPARRARPADQVRLTVRLDRALHARLRALAARQRRTNQDIVEGALEAYLKVFATACACVRDPKAKA